MAKKLRVGIIFGGRSTEHEVSLRSAKSVIKALDTKKYSIVPICIDKQGTWLNTLESQSVLSKGKYPKKKQNLIPNLDPKKIDVVFPVLHGAYGEDGTVQGFLKLVGVPFVGPGILGSSVGMDKDVTKRLLNEAGINVAEGVVVKKHQTKKVSFSDLEKSFNVPLFVKPANAGSSVGVSKVRTEKEFKKALSNAFRFDTKVLVEKFVPGREIECAVLGNENPVVAIPGEIVPGEEFYSYDDKYASTSTSVAQIPADISKELAKEIMEKAVVAYQVLELEGMTRVDFFLTKENKLILNEVNTIPGFTSISMYPKMWEASGLTFSKLVDRLIELAILRFERESSLETSVV